MVQITGGYRGRFAGAVCHYCGWISQSLDVDEAVRLNTEHEKTHPEYKPPPTSEQVMAAIDREHKAHDCQPGPCVCVCGCRNPCGCRVMFGPLCTSCHIGSMRGDDCDIDPALWDEKASKPREDAAQG